MAQATGNMLVWDYNRLKKITIDNSNSSKETNKIQRKNDKENYAIKNLII